MNILTLPYDLEKLRNDAADYDTWSLVRAARQLEQTATELLELAEKQLGGANES